jgi:hypothetical protein
MWLAKPDPLWNSEGPHCDEGKLNIDTSVRRFNILDPLRGLDLERKETRNDRYPHPAPCCTYDTVSQDKVRNTNGAVCLLVNSARGAEIPRHRRIFCSRADFRPHGIFRS